jgi:hypothetical protein
VVPAASDERPAAGHRDRGTRHVAGLVRRQEHEDGDLYALADLDGDDQAEILVGVEDGRLYCPRGNRADGE